MSLPTSKFTITRVGEMIHTHVLLTVHLHLPLTAFRLMNHHDGSWRRPRPPMVASDPVCQQTRFVNDRCLMYDAHSCRAIRANRVRK